MLQRIRHCRANWSNCFWISQRTSLFKIFLL